MEKLEPLLRYKFWISFGAALLLPSIGWMMASGSMSKDVNETWSTVEKKFVEITDLKNRAGSFPNSDYAKGLDEIAKDRHKSYGLAHFKLRTEQLKCMVWPSTVADEMAKLTYFQPQPEIKVSFLYGNSYELELDRVRQKITPYDPDLQEGLVDMPEAVMPRANTSDWLTGAKGEAVWDAQEDIWLLTAIMEAIARVDKDATSIVDAPIKSIQEVTLRGGSPQKAQKRQSLRKQAAASEEAANPRDRNADESRPKARDVGFTPAEEFGDETIPNPKAAAKSQDDDDSGKRGRVKRKKNDDAPGGEPATLTKRYIEGDNKSGYKTRGFYIQVAMKNTFIPELLAELSNMPYPTQIVRVQFSDEVNTNYVKGRVEEPAPRTAAAPAATANPATMPAPAFKGGVSKGGFSKGAGEKSRMSDEKKVQKEQKKLLDMKGKKFDPRAEGMQQDLMQAAMKDPYLGTVVIAGTMTIYQQDLDPATAKPNPSDKSKAAAPAESEEPAPSQPPEKQPLEAVTEKPAAKTDDKNGPEKKGPGQSTNGK